MSHERFRDRADAIHVGTRRVRQNGMVTIPKDTRDRFGIRYGDRVDIVLLVPGHDDEVRCEGCKVIGRGQVVIPSDVRDEYGAEPGTYLDLTVVPRGADAADE